MDAPPADFDPSQQGIDVSGLSEGERKLIWGVLKRDEDLRKRDEQRINRLKAELQWLRRRGAIKGGLDAATSCARCRQPLGRIINRGAPCTVCRAKVCKSCRVHSSDGADWICVVCHKQLELEAATGEWMNEFVRRASRRRDRKAFVPPSDLVKECIARAHHERSQHARMEREGNQVPRTALAVPTNTSAVSARRKTFMEPSSERRGSRQLPNIASVAKTSNTINATVTNEPPPPPAKPGRRPSSSFADVALVVGNNFVREGERDRDESPRRSPSPRRRVSPSGALRSSISTSNVATTVNHRQMPPVPLARQRSTSPRHSVPEAADRRSWCEVDGDEEGEVERVQLRVHSSRTPALPLDNAPVPFARKRLLPTTPVLQSDWRSDSGLGTEGCASPKTSQSGSGASRHSSTNSSSGGGGNGGGGQRDSQRFDLERNSRNEPGDRSGRRDLDRHRKSRNNEPVGRSGNSDRSDPVDRTSRDFDQHRNVRNGDLVDYRGGNSDLKDSSDRNASRRDRLNQLNSRDSTLVDRVNGRNLDLDRRDSVVDNDSRVGGALESQTNVDTTVSAVNSAANSGSELSDSEAEPTVGGVVFRKVTLKRRKKREAPQPPTSTAVDSTTSTDVGTDDHDDDHDGRNRISYVPLPRWHGLPGATFSLPRLSSRNSATKTATARHHHHHNHFPRSCPATTISCDGSGSDPFAGGSLTHTGSIDSLWWDGSPSITSGTTTVIAVNGASCDSRREPCGRSASPRDGYPIRFTGATAHSTPLGGASGLSRSLEAIDAEPDGYPWSGVHRRTIEPSGGQRARRQSGSFDDLRVSSPEYEEDYSLCGGFPASANNNNSDSCSDILLHVNDRIVPEGEEYRIVFISSSSSKSSGLNSADSGSGDDSALVGGWTYGAVLPQRWPAVGRSRSLSPPPLPATPPPANIHFQPLEVAVSTDHSSVRCGTSPTYTFYEDELFGVIGDDLIGDKAGLPFDSTAGPIVNKFDNTLDDIEDGECVHVSSSLPPVIVLRNHSVDHVEHILSEQSFYNQLLALQSPTSPLLPPGGFRNTSDDEVQLFLPLAVMSCEERLLSPPAGFQDSLPVSLDFAVNSDATDCGTSKSATWCEKTPPSENVTVSGIMRQRSLDPGAIEFSDETDLSDDEASSTSSDSENELIDGELVDSADGYYVDDALDSSDDECLVGSYDVSCHMESEDALDTAQEFVNTVVALNVSSGDSGEELMESNDACVDVPVLKPNENEFENCETVKPADIEVLPDMNSYMLPTSLENQSDILPPPMETTNDISVEPVEQSFEHVVSVEPDCVSETPIFHDLNTMEKPKQTQIGMSLVDVASTEEVSPEPDILNESIDTASVLENIDDISVSENIDDADTTLVACDTTQKNNSENCTASPTFLIEQCVSVASTAVADADGLKNVAEQIVITTAESNAFQDVCNTVELLVSKTPENAIISDSATDTDKTESDTDSQDTVIEGEAYRRIRQVAIREKLLQANRDWELANDGLPFFPVDSAAGSTTADDDDNSNPTSIQDEPTSIDDSASELESLNSDIDDCTAQASRPGANLQALIAQSRALSAARNHKNDGSVTEISSASASQSSVLEKYFVSTLEHVAPPGTRKHIPPPPPNRHTQTTSKEVTSHEGGQFERLGSDTEDNDEYDDSCSDISDQYRGSAASAGGKNSETTTTDEDSETTFDDDDNSSTASSTSSDEGSMCLQQVTVRQCVPERQQQRHLSLDMSLHTIMEESCEESESERERYGEHKRRRLPSRVADPSDLERYFQFAFSGHASTSSPDLSLPLLLDDTFAASNEAARSRPPRPLSEVESEFSDDTVSETESSVFSEAGDHRGDDVDDEELARLASSRLEKYFLTGFLGLEAGGSMRYYGEDDPVTPTGDRPGGDNPFSPAAARRGSLATDSSDEESTPFEINDGCDTIKRCKKKDRINCSGDNDNSQLDPSREGSIGCVLFSDSAVASDRDTESATPEAEDTMLNENSISSGADSTQVDQKNSQTAETSLANEESCLIANKTEVDDILPLDTEVGHNSECDVSLEIQENKNNAKQSSETSKVDSLLVDGCLESQSLPVTILTDESHTHLDNTGLISWDATCYTFTDASSPSLGVGIGRGLTLDWKQQSRDSGFIGSSDDLLHVSTTSASEESVENAGKTPQVDTKSALIMPEAATNLPDVVATAAAITVNNVKEVASPTMTPSASHGSFGLFRSSSTRSARSTCSDDEAHYIVHQLVAQIARSMTRSPQMARAALTNTTTTTTSATTNNKPSEMEEFECQLTRLMRTVPGVDATVKEIVEELSSTDYCSDSYEESSEDYAGSDHDVALHATDAKFPTRFALGSNHTTAAASLRRNDSGRSWRSWSSTASKNSAFAVGGDIDDEVCLPEETMSIYNRFMESLSKMAGTAADETTNGSDEQNQATVKGSPPITAKIVHHIRSRLTSLMREVHDERSTMVAAGRPIDEVQCSGGSLPRRAVLQWNKPSSATASAAGDELSLSSTTSSANFDSEEDSPTDKELSMDSDEDPISALPVAAETTRKKLSGCAGGSARALAEARAHVKAIAKSGGDLSSQSTSGVDHNYNGSSLDGLERWSSDVTIVGDGDVRFTSVRKSEPALSAPSPSREERTGAPPSKTGSSSAMSSSGVSPAGSSRYVSVAGKNASTGSLFSQHHPRSKCRSEWEVWRGDSTVEHSVGVVEDSGLASPLSTTHAPTKHKSCDPLLPTGSPSPKSKSALLSKSESRVYSSEIAAVASSSPTPPLPTPPPPPPVREKRRHGLASFLLGSLSKSASSTSLRDGGNGPSSNDYASAKQQVQFRSSLHLHTTGGKKSKDDRRHHHQQHQGSPSSSHPMQWLFGFRHRDNSSKKGGPGSSFSKNYSSSTSRSSPSVLAGGGFRPSSPLDGVDVTTASGIDLSDDDELDDERRSSRHSSLVHVAHHHHHQPHRELPADPYSTVPGHGFYRPSFVPSGAASSRDVSTDASRASTLPRAFSAAAAPVTTTTSSHSSSSKTSKVFQHSDRAAKSATMMPTPSIKKQTTVVELGSESPKVRREVHSWPDENSLSEAVTKKAPMPNARSGNREKALNQSPHFQKNSTNVPSISVVDCPERSATLSRLGAPSSHAGSSDPDSMTEEDIDRLVALHKNRSLSSLGVCSESMSSVYSAAGGGHYGNVTVRGEVQIGLSYNYVSGALEVHIKQCRDLAPVDTKRNRSDPYAKVYLLPDKSKTGKRKTRVKKHTLNPLFNEVLKFQVTISELETRTLWLTVFHSDMFGRNEFLGEVTLPMGYEAWDDPTAKWYMLQEKLGSPEEVYSYKGDLLVALRYVPPDVTMQKKGRRTKGSLHVLVKEARNLMALCANGTSDPFCKCYLLPDKGKGNKQKTPVVRRNCNPKWNHTFVYEDVCLDSLHERCLELTVWDYDRLTSNDFLGGVRLSQGMGKCQGKKVDWMDSRGEEVSIWQAMLERPNVWVDGTVLLRPSMDHRQTTW